MTPVTALVADEQAARQAPEGDAGREDGEGHRRLAPSRPGEERGVGHHVVGAVDDGQRGRRRAGRRRTGCRRRSPRRSERIAATRLTTPMPIGMSASSQSQCSGTRARPRPAASDRPTRTAKPRYCPAQISHRRGRPSARDAALSSARTTKSSMLVPANRRHRRADLRPEASSPAAPDRMPGGQRRALASCSPSSLPSATSGGAAARRQAHQVAVDVDVESPCRRPSRVRAGNSATTRRGPDARSRTP